MTRILVVEDEPAIALALEEEFKSEGYEVEVVEDGETASRRARNESFDAIVLDLMLPRKDGYEVCRELRRAGVASPILMLTAKTLLQIGKCYEKLGRDEARKTYRPNSGPGRLAEGNKNIGA